MLQAEDGLIMPTLPVKFAGMGDAEPHQIVSPDYAAHAMCEAAQTVPADILVVGTHRQGVLGRLLIGSTAQRCLNIAPVPVLMVPEEAR